MKPASSQVVGSLGILRRSTTSQPRMPVSPTASANGIASLKPHVKRCGLPNETYDHSSTATNGEKKAAGSMAKIAVVKNSERMDGSSAPGVQPAVRHEAARRFGGGLDQMTFGAGGLAGQAPDDELRADVRQTSRKHQREESRKADGELARFGPQLGEPKH